MLFRSQKKRALQFWNKSKINHPEALKDQINDDVMKHLNHGKVLPIFHTLCRPPNDRLFPPNTRVSVENPTSDEIRLSAGPVQMGKFDKELPVDEIPMEDELSYILAFIDDEGRGRMKVQDNAFQWSFSENYTEIVTNLVNSPAEMIGEDIEVTKLVAPFALDISNGCNLITRRLSRGVVADCFDKSKLGSTYAMVGNPGIGKSWTLIYALQQALLYENACVLLCFQKDSMAIVCLRRNNRIYVWHSYNDRWKNDCNSRLFRNSSVLVLLDPRESSNNGASYVAGPRMLIFAASNNKEHFKSIGKFTGDFARISSCPRGKEMKCQIRYMQDNSIEKVSWKVALERASKVGYLPRYILSETLFRERLDQTMSAIDELKQNDVKSILNTRGTDRKNRTVNGCIFAVHVNLKKKSIVPSYKSIVDPGEESDENSADENAGYDGQCVLDYGDRVLSIMNKYVLDEIVTLSRVNILSFWGITSTGKRSEMGHIVENMLWKDLKKPYQMRRFPMTKETKTMNALDAESTDEENLLDIGICQPVSDIRLDKASLGEKVFNASSSVVARMHTNEALIDFAGPYRRVYQVTVSANHSMSHKGLEALFLASGHLDRREENGTVELMESQNAKDIGNIEYYWVVPKERESVWKKRAPKTIRKQTVVGDCLRKYVTQYILVMDEVPTESAAGGGT